MQLEVPMTSNRKINFIRFTIATLISAMFFPQLASAQPKGGLVLKDKNGKVIVIQNPGNNGAGQVAQARIVINGKEVVLGRPGGENKPIATTKTVNMTEAVRNYMKQEIAISKKQIAKICNQFLYPDIYGPILDSSPETCSAIRVLINATNCNDKESIEDTKAKILKLGKQALPEIYIIRSRTTTPERLAFLNLLIQEITSTYIKDYDQIVRNLKSRKYKTRSEASEKLIELGEIIVPKLEKTLLSVKNPEVTQRIRVAIDTIENNRAKRAISLIYAYKFAAPRSLTSYANKIQQQFYTAQSDYNRVRFGRLRNKLSAEQVAEIKAKYHRMNLLKSRMANLKSDFFVYQQRLLAKRAAMWSKFQEEKVDRAKQAGQSEIGDFGASFSDDTDKPIGQVIYRNRQPYPGRIIEVKPVMVKPAVMPNRNIIKQKKIKIKKNAKVKVKRKILKPAVLKPIKKR